MIVRGVWRSRLVGMVAVTCSLLCAAALGKQDDTRDGKAGETFRVAGVVVSAKTGEALAQARITLVNTKNPREARSMITQEDGRFAFVGLVVGKYSLQGARRGYLAAAYEQHEEYSTAIVTGKEFDTENLRLRLVPMASLTGTIVDENGEGVREAQVRLYRETHRDGTTRVAFVQATGADDQGTFEFVPIGPGNYYVSASAAVWYAMRSPTTPATAGGSPGLHVDRSLDVVYPTTFYGGSTNSDGAEAIAVKPGEHAQIDIRLGPVPAAHLVLHVGDYGQHGFRMPEFQARTFDALESTQFRSMQVWQSSSTPGVVEIGGLAPGRYSLRMPENGTGELKEEAEVELKEEGQDLSDWRGQPLGSVKLLVKALEGEDIPKQINIGLQDGQNKMVAYSHVDAHGEAKFQGLAAGKYGVRVFGPDRAYAVTQMSSQNSQISGSAFALQAGESQTWTVSLASGKTNIEGIVKRGGRAASGVMVVLIPSKPETHQDLFRRDQSDLDGSFVLRSVVPGSYTIVAIEEAWGFDWSQPTLLARYAQHGQAVTIEELMRGTVSLLDPLAVQPR